MIKVITLCLLLSSCAWPPSEHPLTGPDSAPVTSSPIRRPHLPPEKPKVINVLTNKTVDKDWELDRQIAEWNKAKYVDFRRVKTCPVASPCVFIFEGKVAKTSAAETDFATGETDMEIRLAGNLPVAEKAATMCHELGHILGLPHLLSPKSCMNDLGYLVKYPTASDIAVVDSYGQWTWVKASEYSGS